MTITNARGLAFGLAALLAASTLAACNPYADEHFDAAATASAETVDMIAADVAACPAIKPMLTSALADNRITQGEARAMGVRAVKLSDASDLADSYDDARRAAGLRTGPPHQRCDIGLMRNLDRR